MASSKRSRRAAAVKENPGQYAAHGAADEYRAIYVEPSALLAGVLEHDVAVRRVIETGKILLTTALTFAECARTCARARMDMRLLPDEEAAAVDVLQSFRARSTVLPMSNDVLGHAHLGNQIAFPNELCCSSADHVSLAKRRIPRFSHAPARR